MSICVQLLMCTNASNEIHYKNFIDLIRKYTNQILIVRSIKLLVIKYQVLS